jgi:phage-related protein
MPRTEVVFYRDDDGSVPVLQWLDELPLKARLKLVVRLERLRELGHELRRPEADFLRDGIHELRMSLNHVQYRILYAFHTETRDVPKAEIRTAKTGSVKQSRGKQQLPRRTIAVLAHGIIKEGRVPDEEIDRARVGMERFASDPAGHTHRES